MHYINNYILFLLHTFNYLSLRKITNFIGLYSSYLFHRKVLNFTSTLRPAFISVEPADFCQLKCPECPVGQKAKSSGNLIDNGFFSNYIDELKRELFHVIFYFQGEPLLNRNLHQLINYAHNAKIFTSTSTNAQLLNSERAKELVLSGLDKLIVSMDGTTQEVYEQYRKGGKLIKAIEGVQHINKWKKELKSITPLVEIQFIVLKTNEHQMKEIKTLAKSLEADRLVFKSAQLYDFENGNDLLTSFEKYSRYKKTNDGKYKVKNALPNHCSRLWSAAVISSKGDLIPCCYDKDGTHSFGNLADRSFGSVWHNSKATEFRMSVLSNRKQHEMCRNCTGK